MVNPTFHKTICAFLVLQIAGAPVFAAQSSCQPLDKSVVYLVEKNDQIGQILHRLGLKPLYGHKGTIETVKKINKLENVDLVFVGKHLILPLECRSDLERFSYVESTDSYIVQSILNSGQAFSRPEVCVSKETDAPGHTENGRDVERPNSYSALGVSGIFGFYRISSVEKRDQSQAELLSSSTLGANINWRLHWDEKISSLFSISYSQIEFEQPVVGSVSIRKQDLSSLETHLSYKLSELFESSVGVGYQQRLFILADQVGQVRLDAVDQMSLNISTRAALLRRGALGLDGEVSARQYLPTKTMNYALESFTELGLSIGVFQRFQDSYLSLDLQYWTSEQSSDISSQRNRALLVNMGFKKELGR